MAVTERLRERLAREESILRQAFPNAAIDFSALAVILTDYRLPSGWSHEHTDVLFQVPQNYPVGRPDNICVRPDLTLSGGAKPGNSQRIVSHAGRRWLQLSYHINKEDWRPQADPATGTNLADYLIGALNRLQEAS